MEYEAKIVRETTARSKRQKQHCASHEVCKIIGKASKPALESKTLNTQVKQNSDSCWETKGQLLDLVPQESLDKPLKNQTFQSWKAWRAPEW